MWLFLGNVNFVPIRIGCDHLTKPWSLNKVAIEAPSVEQKWEFPILQDLTPENEPLQGKDPIKKDTRKTSFGLNFPGFGIFGRKSSSDYKTNVENDIPEDGKYHILS